MRWRGPWGMTAGGNNRNAEPPFTVARHSATSSPWPDTVPTAHCGQTQCNHLTMARHSANSSSWPDTVQTAHRGQTQCNQSHWVTSILHKTLCSCWGLLLSPLCLIYLFRDASAHGCNQALRRLKQEDASEFISVCSGQHRLQEKTTPQKQVFHTCFQTHNCF